MKKRTKQFIIACAVPLFLLVGMCVVPLYTLMYGHEIFLQTKPVDPSNPFRGDYVSLQYAAEDIPVRFVGDRVLKKAQIGQNEFNVYVSLKRKSGIYTPVWVTLQKPKNGIFLKAKLNFIDENAKKAYVQYNLDKYYLEDNTGTSWERASQKGEILAKVKVTNGYGILTGIEKK